MYRYLLAFSLTLSACAQEMVSVQAIPGKFTVARSQRSHCAVRFFDGYNGDETARYESYFQSDGSGDFTKPNVLRSLGEVALIMEPDPKTPELGRVRGDSMLHCGTFSIPWMYRNHLFPRTLDIGHAGFELALTEWSELSAVQVTSPALSWVGVRSKCWCGDFFAP